MLNDKYTLTYDGKFYRINLDKITEYCLISIRKPGSENEITEAYEYDDNGEFRLTSKMNREITSPGAFQNDMIIYDFVKALITKVLDTPMTVTSTETQVDFGFALAFNTLLEYGMVEEIKEEN